jgi:hypothetical protein
MKVCRYVRSMREVCQRRLAERNAVSRLPVQKIDVAWAKKWLSFVEGRSGPPGAIPDQPDRNQLWKFFKSIYSK